MGPEYGATFRSPRMKRNTGHRTSLRMDDETYRRIEQARRRDGGSYTMSAWLARAVEEKLQREEAALGAGQKRIRPVTAKPKYTFYEFFAGGGMARAGLGSEWKCVLANDFDPMKARAYRENWNGGEELIVADINLLESETLPGPVDMAWASFPCQDLSLAGNYSGIGGRGDAKQTRSGTFWAFWRLVRELLPSGRQPPLVVLENVYGILTSNEGQDFAAIGDALTELGYRFGAVVVDAKLFVPQSRPRVFIIAVRAEMVVPAGLASSGPSALWHPERMIHARSLLSSVASENWVWWRMDAPPPRSTDLVDIIEDDPRDVDWHSPEQTRKLVSMMSDVNITKLESAKKAGQRVVGSVYRRTRTDAAGNKIQRAEVRFDSVAGCLRTPSGGSSRQIIMVVEGARVRTRLLSSREAARLMGLPDTYVLPRNYNDAYHVAGDGVAVPAVAFIAEKILRPILRRG